MAWYLIHEKTTLYQANKVYWFRYILHIVNKIGFYSCTLAMLHVVAVFTAGHAGACVLVEVVWGLTGSALITAAAFTRLTGRVALLTPLPVPPETLGTAGHTGPGWGRIGRYGVGWGRMGRYGVGWGDMDQCFSHWVSKSKGIALIA